jgi:hypothetical protein
VSRPKDVEHGLSDQRVRTLDKEIRDSGIGTRIARIKLWNRTDTVVYSDERRLVVS